MSEYVRHIEGQTEPRFVSSGLHFDLNKIPDDPKCFWPCEGNSCYKILTELQFVICDHGKRVVVYEHVPGYRCDNCELDTFYIPTGIEFAKVALELAMKAGDKNASTLIEDEIRNLELNVH